MVNFASPALAAIALSALVVAIPTTTSNAPFTFVQWVEDIIASPDGDHLSPEEAVAAKDAAVNTLALLKRATCDVDWPRANANDAAGCLQYLAGLGSRGVNCGLKQSEFSVEMCRQGNARISGSTNVSPAASTNCNEVARAGGRVFDSCWRADNTVMGSEILPDRKFQVNVLGL